MTFPHRRLHQLTKAHDILMRACNRIQATKLDVPGGISHLLIKLREASSNDGMRGISAFAMFQDMMLSFCQTLSGHGKRIFILCTCIIKGCLGSSAGLSASQSKIQVSDS